MAPPASCDASLKTKEMFHGVIVSGVSGVGYAAFVWVGEKLSKDPRWVTPTASVLFNVIGYIFDILIAKKCYVDHSTGVLKILRYDTKGWIDRLKWLIRSFATLTFVKYCLLTVLDTLMVTKLLERAKRIMNDNDVLTKHKAIRNAAASVLISLITFNLYVNILRFRWAYSAGPDDLVITVILVMWMSLLFFYEDTVSAAK
nr:hypothetical protein TetV2_00149 [Oceanusvirus sp.]